MKLKENIFIGVAWPYVNGQIHVGHLAGYIFPADIYARYRRAKGDDVLMVSGSDCFGTPITVEAEKRGISYQALVDLYHPKHKHLFETLKITFDNYTKTANPIHINIVQSFFKKGLVDGVITIEKSMQFYDAVNNKFLADRYVYGTCPKCGFDKARGDECDNCCSLLTVEELVNPKSKNSDESVALKETEHYYYNWQKSQDFLEEYFSQFGHSWRKWIQGETKKWLDQGLIKRAITRDITWGVEIPTDIEDKFKIEGLESKRIYVWFDAVIGYLSASIEHDAELYKKYWHNTEAKHYYFMGKDNLVFHTLFWPYQIHSYDNSLNLPNYNIVNNFLNLDGQKFSKSRGVTIDSLEIVEEFGLEQVKYYITSIMPENTDSSFNWEDFEQKVNSVLVGNYGNFVFRSAKLLEKATALDYTHSSYKEICDTLSQLVTKSDTHIKNCEYKKYLETVMEIASLGNKTLQDKQPWMIKNDNDQYNKTISLIIPILYSLAIVSVPIFFDSSKKILNMLGLQEDKWSDDFHNQIINVIPNIKINLADVAPLFTKIELKKVD